MTLLKSKKENILNNVIKSNSSKKGAISLVGKDIPEQLDLLKVAENFFSRPCRFLIGTTDFNLFPKSDLVEFAFIGRSNVGKSSLLNALVKQKALARVSVTPGRTQQVNFFSIDDKIILVDLPGYGFAKAPKNLVRAWERMSLGYLKNRASLKRLFVLIDSRHGFKDNDFEFIQQLDKFAIPYQLVLTKLDKTNQEQVAKIISSAQINFVAREALFPELVLTSSKQGYGLNELRAYIYSELKS